MKFIMRVAINLYKLQLNTFSTKSKLLFLLTVKSLHDNIGDIMATNQKLSINFQNKRRTFLKNYSGRQVSVYCLSESRKA